MKKVRMLQDIYKYSKDYPSQNFDVQNISLKRGHSYKLIRKVSSSICIVEDIDESRQMVILKVEGYFIDEE